MKLMRYWVLTCFLFIINTYLSSQVSTDQIIFFKDQDTKKESWQKLNEGIFSIRYETPWVDRFEFRTETDRLMTSRQEFLFRTSFNSFRQKKADGAVLFHLAERKKWEFLSQINDMVNQRYFLTLEAIKKQLELKGKLTRESYFLKMEKTYEAYIQSGESFDLADYLKNHEDLQSIRLSVVLSKKELSTILFNLGFPEQDSMEIRDLITVKNMAAIAGNVMVDVDKHPEFHELDAKNSFLDARLHSDKVKDGKILDFAQLRYSVRNDLLLENRFSVGVGLNFPWRGSSRTKYSDILIDKLETNHAKEEKRIEMKEKLTTLQNQLAHQKKMYEVFTTASENAAFNNVKKTILGSGRVNLHDILSLEKYELNKAEKETELFLDILKTYLDILSLTATLGNQREVNYFKNLE
ncbi:MAG: hypothetical protein IPL20_18210 [Saprospiraceae bacterium]|nr:hypothetical protein [Saprospiraceae bacterium]MBK8853930.1 hypothetical protein [Saprospiraceae bacterium]